MALALLGSAVAASGQTMVDAERGFTFQVPAGFHRLDRDATPDTLYTFATSDPIAGVPNGMVLVQRMRGNIRVGDHLQRLPADAPMSATLALGKWHSIDVDVLQSNTWVKGVPVAVRCAQIPLPNEAVQVVLMQRSNVPKPVDQVLTAVLDGLAVVGEDPSSPGITAASGSTAGQLSAERRGELLAQGLGLMTITVAVAVGLYRKHLRAAQP